MEDMDIAVTPAIQRIYKAAFKLRQSPNLPPLVGLGGG